MALEPGIEDPGATIETLVRTNPEGTDTKNFGPNHMRGLKNTVLNTLVNVTGAITLTQDEINEAYPPLGLTMADISMCNAGLVLFGNNKPARACVQVAALPKDSKIEIDAIATTQLD